MFSYMLTGRITLTLTIFLGITNAREAMKKLPEEDRAKIEQQVEVFRIEKRAFDNEVRNITYISLHSLLTNTSR